MGMAPLVINVNIADVTLETVVAETWGHEDGPPQPLTIADLVATTIVDRLSTDTERWGSMVARVSQLRDEAIREKLEPVIAAALTAPLTPTNGYGQAKGEQTTLEEIITDKAQKLLTQPERHGVGGNGQTLLDKMVADAVGSVLKPKIGEIVTQVQAALAEMLGAKVGKELAGKLIS